MHKVTGGIIASVNHKGDSDSTGAVTGNILGGCIGLDEIDNKWKHNLEHYNVLKELSDDLFHGDEINPDDTKWKRKYTEMKRSMP